VKFNLLLDDSDISSARETVGKGAVDSGTVGARSASLISPVSRWSSVDSMVLLDCTDYWRKRLRESDKAFFKDPDTTIASQNSEKNHSEGRGTMVFILITLDYSGGISFVN